MLVCVCVCVDIPHVIVCIYSDYGCSLDTKYMIIPAIAVPLPDAYKGHPVKSQYKMI